MCKTGEDDFKKEPLSVLIGPQYSRVNIKVHQQLRAIRVDFFPGAMHRLFKVPMHQLFDKAFGLDCFHSPGTGSIDEQLQNTASLEEGKKIVERFLLHLATDSRQPLPFDRAMQVLLNNSGNMSIDSIASLSCLSLKQFERVCKERIGMNPKLYARILKFSKAYILHERSPQLSWINIAHEAGYYDQMHMIRDFRVFAGVNPSVIEQQLLSTPLRMQKDLIC
jgi:AraC-like DNA-binding protein